MLVNSQKDQGNPFVNSIPWCNRSITENISLAIRQELFKIFCNICNIVIRFTKDLSIFEDVVLIDPWCHIIIKLIIFRFLGKGTLLKLVLTKHNKQSSKICALCCLLLIWNFHLFAGGIL